MGLLLTNSKEFYEKLLMLRTHGITKETDKLEKKPRPLVFRDADLGYNYRITEIQAALGRSQLKKLDQLVAVCREIAKIYDQELNGNQYFETISPPPNSNSVIIFTHYYFEMNI